MNALKFQQDALKARMTESDDKRTVCWVRKCSTQVALFLHGHVCAFIPDEYLILDTAKLEEVPSALRFVESAKRAWTEDNLLTPTEDYRFTSGNKKIRIYKARAWQMGIDQSLLKYFDAATMRLYQLEDKGGILITEKTKGF
jgi:hypothetical protein